MRRRSGEAAAHAGGRPASARHVVQVILAGLLLAACSTTPDGVRAAEEVTVNFGYFGEPQTHLAGVAEQMYNANIDVGDGAGERAYRVKHYHQQSGGDVIRQLDNRELDIALLGSTPFAYGVARDLDVLGLYISHSKGKSQNLVVKEGLPIFQPRDLEHTPPYTIATPFLSTAHYHLLFLLAAVGIDVDKVNLVNMAPGAVAAVWDADEIDGVFVWGGALQHVSENGGRTLVYAETLIDWGRPTYNIVVARRAFIEAHPAFVQRFVDVLALLDTDFQDSQRHLLAWTEGRPYLQGVVSVLRGPEAGASGEAFGLDAQINAFGYLTIAEMHDFFTEHLATSVAETAEFLFDNKALAEASVGTRTGADYEAFLTNTFLDAAERRLASGALHLSNLTAEPYAAEYLAGGADVVAENVCPEEALLSLPAGGSLHNFTADGSNPADRICTWVFAPADEGDVVTVWLHDMWLQGFGCDLLEHDSGDVAPRLARFTGLRLGGATTTSAANGRFAAPGVAHRGAIRVQCTFKADGLFTKAYGVGPRFGVASEQRVHGRASSQPALCVSDDDCGGAAGAGSCDATGWCECAVGWSGAHCEQPVCMGTRLVQVAVGTSAPFATTPDVSDPANRYPNDWDCRWVIRPMDGSTPVVSFDTFRSELHFDAVKVYSVAERDGDSPALSAERVVAASAAGQDEGLRAVKSGTSAPWSVVGAEGEALVVVFSTDSMITEAGFDGVATAVASSGCSAGSDVCGTHGTCDDSTGTCVCEAGYFGSRCAVPHCAVTNEVPALPQGSLRSHADEAAYASAGAHTCSWVLAPLLERHGSEAALGVRLRMERFELEPESGDRLVVWADGDDGAPLRSLVAASSTCGRDADCNLHGACLIAAGEDLGRCECEEDWVSGDCSVPRTLDFLGVAAVRLSLEVDINNRDESGLAGVQLGWEGIFACAGNCTSPAHGTCSLGVCECGALFAGEECAVSLAGAAGDDDGAPVWVGPVVGVLVLVFVLVCAALVRSHHFRRVEAQESVKKHRSIFNYFELDFGEQIGAGAFGTVHKGRFRGTVVAIKRSIILEKEADTQSDSVASLRVDDVGLDVDDVDLDVVRPASTAKFAASKVQVAGPRDRETVRRNAGRSKRSVGSSSSGNSRPSTNLSFKMGSVLRSKLGSLVGSSTAANTMSIRAKEEHEFFLNEIDLMTSLRHPNIVLFMGCCVSPTLTLVTEFCAGGSLDQRLAKARKNKDDPAARMQWSTKLSVALDTIAGVNYLHQFDPPILHCDLKSGNILLDNGKAKVCDFGMSLVTGDADTVGGSLMWCAPEVLAGEGTSAASDLFAFGVIMSELVNQDYPYVELLTPQLQNRLFTASPSQGKKMFDDALIDAITISHQVPALRRRSPAGFGELYHQIVSYYVTARPDGTVIQEQLQAIEEKYKAAGGDSQFQEDDAFFTVASKRGDTVSVRLLRRLSKEVVHFEKFMTDDPLITTPPAEDANSRPQRVCLVVQAGGGEECPRLVAAFPSASGGADGTVAMPEWEANREGVDLIENDGWKSRSKVVARVEGGGGQQQQQQQQLVREINFRDVLSVSECSGVMRIIYRDSASPKDDGSFPIYTLQCKSLKDKQLAPLWAHTLSFIL